MFVKMLTVSAGPGGCFPSGTVLEVSDDVGLAIVEGRFGVRVEKPSKAATSAAIPETATVEAPETTMMPRGARKIPSRKG